MPSSAAAKALSLVEAVAASGRPARLSDLARTVELHRATAYRVLVELIDLGWVARQGEEYLPGPALLRLAGSTATRETIVRLCLPVLARLSEETDLMVNVQVLEPHGSRLLEAVRPQRYVTVATLVGELLPVDRSAGAMALVAALPPIEQEHYVERARADGHPIDGPGGLRAELAAVARDGFAMSVGRLDDVVASVSRLARDPTGHLTCALTVVGLATEMHDGRLDEVRRSLTDAVTDLEARLALISAPPASETTDPEQHRPRETP
ncbi:MAG: IclR family transcriptional regulator [Pseudonocardia sp.]|nr:IclR family transcriptional regulator [Pseudonocardia sp.]